MHPEASCLGTRLAGSTNDLAPGLAVVAIHIRHLKRHTRVCLMWPPLCNPIAARCALHGGAVVPGSFDRSSGALGGVTAGIRALCPLSNRRQSHTAFKAITKKGTASEVAMHFLTIVHVGILDLDLFEYSYYS